MATMYLYNHTLNRFSSGDNSSSDTYKVILLSAAAVFDATDTTLAEITNSGVYEVSGNGWPSGGVAAENPTFSIVETNKSRFACDDIAQDITGGNLGPFSAYVLVNVSDFASPPICFVELSAPKVVVAGRTARIEWAPSGIIVWEQGA